MDFYPLWAVVLPAEGIRCFALPDMGRFMEVSDAAVILL